jgi:hypothetical protein
MAKGMTPSLIQFFIQLSISFDLTSDTSVSISEVGGDDKPTKASNLHAPDTLRSKYPSNRAALHGPEGTLPREWHWYA